MKDKILSRVVWYPMLEDYDYVKPMSEEDYLTIRTGFWLKRAIYRKIHG